jgi:hypothetical protein
MLPFRGAFWLRQISPRRTMRDEAQELRGQHLTAFPDVRTKSFAALLALYWGDFWLNPD